MSLADGGPDATVRVSGFTIARRAVEFGYPLEESLRSLLPLVDELIVNVGDCDDGTWEVVQSIDDPKIKAFRSTWDLALRDGHTLSEETNKALARCRGVWAVYLQADEVLHEADIPTLRAAMNRYENSRAESVSLLYHHFYGSYETCKDDPRHWPRRATRIVRTGVGIESVGDAAAFMVRKGDGWRRLRRRDIRAYLYHYGWVRPPEQMLKKQRSFERLYHDEEWLAERGYPEDLDPPLIYGNLRHLRPFTGTHPAVMRERIAGATWPEVVTPEGRWPDWLRRARVYGAWVVSRVVARLRARG